MKRRAIAQDMVKEGVVYLNGVKAKGSKTVKVGDRITIKYLKGERNYQVLQIPTTKSIPKAERDRYVKEL